MPAVWPTGVSPMARSAGSVGGVIPSMLLVGLVLGAVLFRRRIALAVIGALAAVGWAVGIALGDDGSPATALGGLLLAAANLAVGVLFGAALASRLVPGHRPARRRGQSST